MDYSFAIGICVAFFAGAIVILTIYRKRIYMDLPTSSEKLAAEFYAILASKVDLKALENSLEAIESERQRIGNDMHDEMGAQLGFILIDLQVLNKEVLSVEASKTLLEMKHNLNNSITSLRNVIDGVLPDRIRNATLSDAIESLCKKLDGNQGTTVYFRKMGVPKELSEQKKLYLYRICQELLNNCFKHSRAWTIFVEINWTDKDLNINIRDTGVGFAVLPKFLERDNKYGLGGIYARCLTIGANPKFTTSGKGTEFDLTLPLI